MRRNQHRISKQSVTKILWGIFGLKKITSTITHIDNSEVPPTPQIRAVAIVQPAKRDEATNPQSIRAPFLHERLTPKIRAWWAALCLGSSSVLSN